jgi:hypothetical protein
MTPQYLEAQRLATLGYRVFPITPGDKAPPLVTDWPNVATADSEAVETWWQQWPEANVGLATAGLLVVDTDTLADGAPNQWPHDTERALELAAAPGARTPRGGTHRFFRQPAGRAWASTTNATLHVDTRADGGYVVAPASVVNGKSYIWLDGSALDCEPDKLAEPPAWLLAALYGGREHAPSVRSDRPGDANPIPDGQRNGTLTRYAGSMRREGHDRGTIEAALLAANQRRCNPPLPDDEVRKIARSVSRYEPDQLAVALAEDWAGQALADAPAPGGPADPGPTPEHLLRIPGFIDRVIDFNLECAPYPNPTLAFAGALALQSFLSARKVRDVLDNRSSLYLIALANSGAGKDYPRTTNQQVLMHTGQLDCVGDAIASGEGLADFLALKPAALMQIDEVDGMLRAIKSGKDQRLEAIVGVLLKIYTSANSQYPMRVKAGREHSFIDQPGLTLLATCIPSRFYESMSPDLLVNGMFARTIVLESDRRGTGQEVAARELPAAIVDVAQWWATLNPGDNNLGYWHPSPNLVPCSAAGASILRDYRVAADEEYGRAEQRGDDGAMAVHARAAEKARRLSLNFACSASHENPAIDAAAARWAVEFTQHQTARMLFMAGAHVAETEFEARCNRAVDVLRKWKDTRGEEWMPGWVWNRKLKGWTPRERDEVEKALFAQGIIEGDLRGMGPSGGRPGAAYRLR